MSVLGLLLSAGTVRGSSLFGTDEQDRFPSGACDNVGVGCDIDKGGVGCDIDKGGVVVGDIDDLGDGDDIEEGDDGGDPDEVGVEGESGACEVPCSSTRSVTALFHTVASGRPGKHCITEGPSSSTSVWTLLDASGRLWRHCLTGGGASS